jgi:hypothetical protein
MTVKEVLGNGSYRVQVQHKPRTNPNGGVSIGNIGELTTTRIFWERILDDTSTASCVVPTTGMGSEQCCAILENVVPIRDELVIYRDNNPVWVGPITRMTYSDDLVTIQANDLSWWLNHRYPRINRTWAGTDLSTIFETLIEDAIDLDDFHMLYEINQSGILGDREIKVNEYKMFGDSLRELANTGIDWTVHLRKLFAGGYTVPNATPIATLRTEHFSNGYDLSIQGEIMCTNALVKGDSDLSTANYGIPSPDFGLVDAVWTENDIKDYNSALQAAKSRWDMFKKPPIFVSNPNKKKKLKIDSDVSDTSSAILAPDAPVNIEKLIPGATVKMSVNYLCRLLEFELRLKRVSVTVENNENVELGLIPVGTLGAGN